MRPLIALLLAFAALPALAHPGHGGETIGFSAGFAHPFGGLDHLLAMLAVGLWSATTARRIWLAPLSFAAVLLAGALLARAGLSLPALEPMIAASVLLLGLLVMTRLELRESAMAAVVAGFALFHGAAHGIELGSDLPLAGMVLATVSLHGAGICIGLMLKQRGLWWQRIAGASIALAGAGLATGLLA